MLLDPVLRPHDNDRHGRLPDERFAQVAERRGTEHLLKSRYLLTASADRQALGAVHAHELKDRWLDGACQELDRDGDLAACI